MVVDLRASLQSSEKQVVVCVLEVVGRTEEMAGNSWMSKCCLRGTGDSWTDHFWLINLHSCEQVLGRKEGMLPCC